MHNLLCRFGVHCWIDDDKVSTFKVEVQDRIVPISYFEPAVVCRCCRKVKEGS